MKYEQSKQEIKNKLLSGQLEEAALLLSDIKEALINDVDLYYLQGMYYEYNQQYNDAIEVMLKGVQKNQYHFELLYGLWRNYYLQGEYIEAIHYFTKAYYVYVNTKIEDIEISLSEIYKILELDIEADIKQEIQKELCKALEELNANTRYGMYKLFPNKDVEEKVSSIGEFVKYKNKEYFIASYKKVISLDSNYGERIYNKCEVLEASSKKYFKAGRDNTIAIVSVAGIEDETQYEIKLENGESYLIKPHINKQFEYHALKGKFTIKSNKTVAIGNPVLLEKDENKKDLIMTIFIDGLSYDFIEKEGIKKVMPNTANFFSEGVICTNTYTSAEWTLPSVATLCTGQYTTHHKLYHPNRPDELSGEIDTLFETLKNEGYITAKIDGNWRTTPTYGYIRGIDRTIYQPAILMMNATEIIEETILQLEAYKGTNQYVWTGFMDLHKIADDISRGNILEQIKLPINCKGEEEQEIAKSVKQQFSFIKKERYKQALIELDRHLQILYDYINLNFNSENIVITLVSDHGQGYLVKNNQLLFAKERTKVPLMIKGYRKGICNELIQLTDYIEILAQVVGIEVKDLQMRDSNLPSFFGGKERSYTYTESLFPGDSYEACINTKKHTVHFKTINKVQYDGRVILEPFEMTILDELTNEIVKSESFNELYLKIIDEHMKWNKIYI